MRVITVTAIPLAPVSAVLGLALVSSLSAQRAGSSDHEKASGSPYASFEIRSLLSPSSDVAMADLDGDGLLDAITTSSRYRGPTTVLLGLPGGHLGRPIPLTDGPESRKVRLGDFTGDGIEDVCLLHYSGSVTVLKNGGNGDFHFVDTIAASTPYSKHLELLDADSDGNLDAAVLDRTERTVQIVLGDGSGRLSLGTSLRTASLPDALAVGDVTLDGIADLVTAEGREVNVYSGDGAGRYAFWGSVSVPPLRVTGVALGDLDGGNGMDVVYSRGGPVEVLLNDGTGQFSPPRYVGYSFGVDPLVTDLDGDGNQDVLMNGSPVNVMYGDGNGSTAEQVSVVTGANPVTVAVGDLDQDGRRDLVVANSASSDLSLVLAEGARHFVAPRIMPVYFGPTYTDLLVADLDERRGPDLVLAEETYAAFESEAFLEVHVSLNQGDGTFRPQSRTEAFMGSPLLCADFDADGNVDVAGSTYGSCFRSYCIDPSIEVALGNGYGHFPIQLSTSTPRPPVVLAASDLDRDGWLDLAVGDGYRLTLYRGDGTGRFQSSFSLPELPSPDGVGVLQADLLRDPFVAGLVLLYAREVWILLAVAADTQTVGPLHFLHPIVIPLDDDIALPGGQGEMVVTDLETDGFQELLVSTARPSKVHVLTANGIGEFVRLATLEGSLLDMAVVDVDGDGLRDLIGRRGTEVVLRRTLPGGRFGPEQRFAAGGRVRALAVADVDRDGGPDLIVGCDYAVGVLYHQGR